MFKIGKLEQVSDEKVSIEVITYTKYYDKKSEEYQTLSFEVTGNNYSISFDLKCEMKELLNLPLLETIDFSKYLNEGETFFNVDDNNGKNPIMNITINRYMKNKYVIFISFYTENDDNYGGIVEFSFDLDDYLDRK